MGQLLFVRVFQYDATQSKEKELGVLEMKDIYNAKAWILTLGPFKPGDKDGVYERDYLPDEDRLGYFHRVLTKVDTKYALVWQLDRLLAESGCAPHSNLQFADELGRDVSMDFPLPERDCGGGDRQSLRRE